MTEELVQGSPEWVAARLGSFGASMLGALMAKGEGKTRAKLIDQLACERLSGKPQGWEGNSATEAGHAQEPLARRAYGERHGVFVQQVGLIRHAALPFSHASPDGLVDEDGGLELKSHVKFMTHFAAIQAGMSKAHVYQCQWGMACTGRSWWDYGHFCAEAPEHMRLHMFPRIQRDETIIATLAVAIRDAEVEVAAKVEQFSKRAA
jgi:hypothetical protein